VARRVEKDGVDIKKKKTCEGKLFGGENRSFQKKGGVKKETTYGGGTELWKRTVWFFVAAVEKERNRQKKEKAFKGKERVIILEGSAWELCFVVNRPIQERRRGVERGGILFEKKLIQAYAKWSFQDMASEKRGEKSNPKKKRKEKGTGERSFHRERGICREWMV